MAYLVAWRRCRHGRRHRHCRARSLILLFNDGSDQTVARLAVTSVECDSLAQGAAVTLNADGTVIYDPSASSLLQRLGAGQCRDRYLSLFAGRRNSHSETGSVLVTMAGTNDAPVATPDLAVVGYKIETVDVPGATSTPSFSDSTTSEPRSGTFVHAAGGHISTYDGTTFTRIENDLYALAQLQGITSSLTPRGINDAGVIVGGISGTSNMSGLRCAREFVYDGTSLLEVRYGVRDNSLADVNNNGLAVGSYVSPGSHGQHTSIGFTYDNGRVGSLTHPDHTNLRGTWLTDANDAGVVVGGYYPGFDRGHAVSCMTGTTWRTSCPRHQWAMSRASTTPAPSSARRFMRTVPTAYGYVFDGTNYESFQYPDWSGWTTLDDINDAGVLAGSAAGHGFVARPATSTDKDTVFVGRTLSTWATILTFASMTRWRTVG